MEGFMMRYAWAGLCIAMLMMSGSAETASLVTLKAANTESSFTYDFTTDITNRIYNDSLLQTKSQDYKILYEEVSSALYSVYGCATCDTHTFYQGVTAMTFSNKAGSVVVQATIMFNSDQTNSVVIKSLFLQAINGRNEINGLKINPEFTQVIQGSAPAPTSVSSTSNPTTTLTTTPTTTPPTQTFTCDPFVSIDSPILYIIMSCLTSTTTITTPTTTTTTTPTTTTTTTPTTTTTTTPTTTSTTTPNATPTITPTTTPTTTTTTTLVY